ncbi:MAG: SUMF1/EgtB/PvdO family nonheme iron enzyme [Bryobacterales bacterium]|nr:SUMF1/EgtB/PvdO family nonheme iron enzyme [Bryobacterales bacterium]WKZ51237.1 MAG: SUMF1/EgtB/PvdO family nonheme iron enzyme [Anaerolineales bacterium]
MPEAKKRKWETPQILSDLPLREKDTAHFYFDEFAATLARLAADPSTRTPLTIGVSGAWGSGKTTLLQRMKTLLDTRDAQGKPFFANADESAEKFRKTKTVWFDAWKYDGEDELLVALVRVILDTMGRGSLGEQLWSEILDKTAPRYDVLATFVNMFKVKFGGLEIGLDLNKYKTDTEFYKHTAFFDHFNPAFEELLARWVHGKGDFRKIDETKGALVVFIDDLDRCLPEKTVQVLETVKLFLDKPGCIFVIGAHTQVVQEAVTKYYAGMSAETASDYLEKIVQLRFELPPILEEQMGGFVTATGLPKESLENWETIVAGAEINPRKVKTFLNDLNLAWSLLVNSGQAQNVERADFTRWQVLMRAAPESFKKQVRDIDDVDLRFKFVQNALAWQNGDAQAAEYFKDYEKHSRLKRTLKKIGAFGKTFDAKTLDAFIHLVAPPKPPEPEKVPAEVKAKPKKETVEIGEEALEEITRSETTFEKGVRREAVPARAGAREWGGISFVPVPKGKFLMGSREDNELAYDNERLQHTVKISSDYWIGQFPVTNEQYDLFVQFQNGKHPVSDWKNKKDHPVVNVSWNDAQAYCKWLNDTHGNELPQGFVFRLPTEAEWEKAARGEFGFEWPWGNEFDENKCNSREGGKGGTTPVGAYSPAGDSPYGAADMVGNVWEWTQSLYKPYPYIATDGREDLKAIGERVLRGGSWSDYQIIARASGRSYLLPIFQWLNYGFRVAAVSPPS